MADEIFEHQVEHSGTEERGQGAEFVDTPENEPGDQEQPPESAADSEQ